MIINEKTIYDLLDKYKHFAGYPKWAFPMEWVLNGINYDIANNTDIKIEINKNIFKQIENIYKKYQQFKSFSINLPILEHETILGQYPIIESIKKNSGFNMKMTPKLELKSNLEEYYLHLLTDILIAKGINPIKEILDIKTNELSIKCVNELTNCLLPTNNYYHKKSL